MDQPTLQGKLLSPAGFGLVLLCFFLPFVAVSCGPADNQLTAEFTGLAMVTGTRPEITGTGLNADDVATIHALAESQYDLEPLALFAAVVIMAGMASALIKRARTRHLVSGSIAAGALVLLIGAVLRAQYRLEHMRGTGIVALDALPAAGVASPRYGFWLAAALLVIVAAGHGIGLARSPREAAAPPPEHLDEPDDLFDDSFLPPDRGGDPGPPR